jgi:hypothetical protein
LHAGHKPLADWTVRHPLTEHTFQPKVEWSLGKLTTPPSGLHPITAANSGVIAAASAAIRRSSTLR